jgi:hypothetical protein
MVGSVGKLPFVLKFRYCHYPTSYLEKLAAEQSSKAICMYLEEEIYKNKRPSIFNNTSKNI